MLKKVDIVLIALSNPLLIGIYEDGVLVKKISSYEKSSECLPVIFEELLQTYTIEKLIYANGPGSFMAIKIAYVFLKSLSILKDIPLFATDAFYFNNNEPIKAIGKLCFVKIASQIQTQKLEIVPEPSFRLPDRLEYNEFTTATAPLYMIVAVS